MANLMSVRLSRGDSPSWGFRLQGGKDFGTPLIIQKINSGSPAEKAGLKCGDAVIKINNIDVFNLKHKDAQDVILRAGPSFEIAVQRGGSTWKPAVSPVGRVTSPRPAYPVNNISPVTATSLAAGRQENIGAIGTSHNISAKPFNAVNGGPALVNKQYNSPLNLYSDKSIAETIEAQSEVLSNGVVGVNFKKNEKSYDSTNSAVFRMVQEADKEPRDYYEPVKRSDFYATHSHAIGSHRQSDHLQVCKSTEEETRSTAENQQLTTCTDCERVIVGVFVRIKDKNLHVECFKCATCGSSLKNVGYYNLNNKLYCDVHAKLAVINNPQAANLVPVTVQPGGKIPSGTISAALASHPLPTAGPLSPNPSYTPVYQPVGRPYSSGISAPISPTNSLPKYSTSPVVPQTEVRCVQSTIWPPPPKESELPTASPLYFPPPSQVHIPQKVLKADEPELSEPDDMSYKTPLGSMEILNLTGARSALESSEVVSDSIETQMLVDSVLKSNQPVDVAVSFTISETDLKKGHCLVERKEATCTKLEESKTCSKLEKKEEFESKTCLKQEQTQSLATMYEKAIKVENTVPQKWESQIVGAPDTSYSPIPSEPDLSLPPPAKRVTTALGAALAVAPVEPFTPVPHASLEPVPLPEYTEPYFPPEHPIVIERTEPKEEEEPIKDNKKLPSKKPASKTKPKATTDADEILKELPKPTKKISMLSALTTAPNRPYSPFSQNETASVRSESCEPEPEVVQQEIVEVEQKPERPSPKPKVFPKPEPCAAVFTAPERLYSPFTANKTSYESQAVETKKSFKNESTDEHSVEKRETRNVQTTENVTDVAAGCPPLIHSIRSTFETKTDKVCMELSCAFPNEPVTTKRYIEKKTDITEEKSVRDKQSSQQHVQQETITQKAKMLSDKQSSQQKDQKMVKNVEKSRATEDQQVLQKPLQTIQVNEKNQEITESTLIQQACSRIQNTTQNESAPKERVTVIQPGQPNLNIPQIAFQPVRENASLNTTFSPRPRSLTPSMINKPAPTLPYYQANLVAIQQPAAEGSIYDPKSPMHSRSPSPYPGMSTSPFPGGHVRAVSPAPGPPPNPLKSNVPVTTIIQNGKVQQARDHVQTFIPQHKSAVSNPEAYSAQSSSYEKSYLTGAIRNQSSSYHQQSSSANLLSDKGQVQEKSSTAEETLRLSGANVVQVQHKKIVKEQYERTQNSKQLEKRVNTSQVCVTEKSDPGVVGVHITNPQPLRSPFIQEQKPVLPAAIPKLTKAAPTPKTSPNVNITPNVSQPNAGTGGGRQSSAVGIAPRRGRGVLNLAASPGSRVPLCAHCHTNIRGPFITALGKIWCPEHFSCATPSCRRALQDLGFVEEQGQLYCEFCFEKYLAPPCAKCSTKVKGDCLKAIGKTFHPECFNCAYCGKLFGNSPFFLEDGQPYCENDWNELFTTKCFACGFPVEAGDRWVEALNNNYHSQCFNCTMCKKNLEGQSFFAKGGRPFCKNHAR